MEEKIKLENELKIINYFLKKRKIELTNLKKEIKNLEKELKAKISNYKIKYRK